MEYIFTETLPGIDPALLEAWLGKRWYCVHRAHYENVSQWTSIVSSRLSRGKPEFRDWPTALAKAVQVLQRYGQTCLIVPGTTTAQWLCTTAQLRRIPRLEVELAAGQSLDEWFEAANQLLAKRWTSWDDRLFISPPLTSADSSLGDLPIQDRASIVLGHSVVALHLRRGGALEQLAQRRLQDRRFPAGTVSVRVGSVRVGTAAKETSRWLEQQAVGWYVPTSPRIDRSGREHPLHCLPRKQSLSNTHLSQCSAPLKLVKSWDNYLVHCVRGQTDRADTKVEKGAILDAILCGRFHQPSAYQILLKIVSQGRLKASNKLLRGSDAAISFSAVPLPELLSRRRYQSHLGRWDWEPYGLLVSRQHLKALGARPVIYGDDILFQQLSADDRAFYQPALRSTAKQAIDHWQAESEWRLPGDLLLHQLPPEAVLLLVEYQHQAEALTRCSPWPVIWLRAEKTQQRPNAGVRRKRSPVQTSRN